jgi:prepilin-type N-terminal cleavage/methylation domain-containing protein
MRNAPRNQQGFSMIEAVIVVGIISVLTAITVFQSFGTMETYEANSALDTVIGQLRAARQVAIAERRPVQVTFTPVSADHGLPTISYTTDLNVGIAKQNYDQDNGVGANNTTGNCCGTPLPRQTQFLLENNVPDTPMAFGMCGPVCIGGVSGGPGTMYFSPTGQFSQDTAGVLPLNGTIFIGIPGRPDTARAVTILGGTGRVRPYTFEVTATSPSFAGHWRE